MTDLHDLSKLPRDRAYWDGLATRILSGLPAAPPAEIPAAPWWSPLATRAWALGGLALAAAIALLLLPHRRADRASTPGGLFRTPESDPVLIAFLAGPAPPSLASLMVPASRTTEHD